jgi:hypothetical protein
MDLLIPGRNARRMQRTMERPAMEILTAIEERPPTVTFDIPQISHHYSYQEKFIIVLFWHVQALLSKSCTPEEVDVLQEMHDGMHGLIDRRHDGAWRVSMQLRRLITRRRTDLQNELRQSPLGNLVASAEQP